MCVWMRTFWWMLMLTFCSVVHAWQEGDTYVYTCLICLLTFCSVVHAWQEGDTYMYTFRHDADGWLCDANI